MSVLPYLIIVALLGLAVGALAPRLLGGDEPTRIERTGLVGVSAAFVAGLFSWYVLNRHGWGIFISVALSMLAVWLYLRSRLAEYGRSRPAEYRRSRPPEYRASRPAEYRASRSAQSRGRAPASRRRPPY